MVWDVSSKDLYREEILEAKRMRPEDKLLEGARLFDQGCERLAGLIRSHFPDADESVVHALVCLVVRRLR